MPAPSTYLLAKLEGSWVLFRPGDTDTLFVGGFVEAWTRARELAAASMPAVVVALNQHGEAVARELFGLASAAAGAA